MCVKEEKPGNCIILRRPNQKMVKGREWQTSMPNTGHAVMQDATVSERNGRIPSPSGVGLHSSSLLVKEGTDKNGIRVRVVCVWKRETSVNGG